MSRDGGLMKSDRVDERVIIEKTEIREAFKE